MRSFASRHIWLKLTLAVGSLLGRLLLVQSVVTYYQVSRVLVTVELRKEAQQHVASIERESRKSGIRDPRGQRAEASMKRVPDGSGSSYTRAPR